MSCCPPCAQSGVSDSHNGWVSSRGPGQGHMVVELLVPDKPSHLGAPSAGFCVPLGDRRPVARRGPPPSSPYGAAPLRSSTATRRDGGRSPLPHPRTPSRLDRDLLALGEREVPARGGSEPDRTHSANLAGPPGAEGDRHPCSHRSLRGRRPPRDLEPEPLLLLSSARRARSRRLAPSAHHPHGPSCLLLRCHRSPPSRCCVNRLSPSYLSPPIPTSTRPPSQKLI